MTARPPEIQDRHLRRKALAYIRQSSGAQVLENVGSTAIQRDLATLLQEWGWPVDAIESRDEDLGVSASTPGSRPGFNRLLARMQAEEIGLVAVSYSNRLSRNPVDFATFGDVARRFDVLLAQDDKLFDFSNPTSELMATILGSIAVLDNRTRTDLFRRARRKKAEVGITPTGAITGYVRLPSGAWDFDPEPRVREVIQLVFDKIFEIGSVRGLVRYLRRGHIQLPRNTRLGTRWRDASYGRVLRILSHPAYTGMYVYGRTTVDERAPRYSNGKHRTRQLPPHDWVSIPHHHPRYITPERGADLQALIRKNRKTLMAPIGRGPALLQGPLRCAVHQLAFVTLYPMRHRQADGRVVRQPLYACRPLRHVADSTDHASIMAHRLDAIVERELLETLTPPSLGLLQEATREAHREHGAVQRGRQDEIRRLETAVAEAERAVDHTDPAHTHVWRRHTQRLDAALRELQDRKALHELQPLSSPAGLTQPEAAELQQLVADVPRLWRDPNVSHEQRKRVLRAAIRAVHATPGRETWTLEIEWAGGTRTQHTVHTERGKRADLGEVFARIRSRFSEGASAAQITAELNAEGIGQARGPWTVNRVKETLTSLRHGQIAGSPPLAPRRGAAARILALHETGLTPSEIVAQLRAEGVVTLRHRPVGIQAVYSALKSHGAHPNSRQERTEADRLIRAHAGTASTADIARALNEGGLRTRHGRPWTTETVAKRVRRIERATMTAPERIDGVPGMASDPARDRFGPGRQPRNRARLRVRGEGLGPRESVAERDGPA